MLFISTSSRRNLDDRIRPGCYKAFLTLVVIMFCQAGSLSAQNQMMSSPSVNQSNLGNFSTGPTTGSPPASQTGNSGQAFSQFNLNLFGNSCNPDVLPPVISCPPDDTISCQLDTLPASSVLASATDNCALAGVFFNGQVNNGGEGCVDDPLVLTRTFSAIDSAGNQSLCTQDITVIDDIAPVISCPADTTINCDVPTAPANTGIPVASDNCELDLQSTSNSIHPTGTPCGSVYQFDVANEMGLVLSDTCAFCGTNYPAWGTFDVLNDSFDLIFYWDFAQDWKVESIEYKVTQPTGINFINGLLPEVDSSWTTIPFVAPLTGLGEERISLSSLPFGCNIIAVRINIVYESFFTGPTNTRRTVYMYSPGGASNPRIQSPYGFEYCTQPCTATNFPLVTNNDLITIGNCVGDKMVTRTWTASDLCGNNAQCVQIINVIDTITPEVVCPNDTIISNDPGICGAEFVFSALLTDVCDLNAMLAYSDTSGSIFPIGTTPVTVVATDDCGNSASCSLNVTVEDTEPPVITCPPDDTLSCELDTVPSAPNQATAMDNCGLVSVDFNGQLSNGGAGCADDPLVITRTYSAVDSAGNLSVCTQDITVIDDTPPAIICPPDTTINCDIPTSPANTGIAIGSDNCELDLQSTSNTIHPTGTPCGSVYQFDLSDDAGVVISDTCFICGTNYPAWGTFDVLNDSFDLIFYWDLAADWRVESIDYKVAPPSGINFTNGLLPEIDSSWVNVPYSLPLNRIGEERISLSTLNPGCNIIAARLNIVFETFFSNGPTNTRREVYLYSPGGASNPRVLSPYGFEYCTQPCLASTYPLIVNNDLITIGNCVGEKVVTRTWTATDLCGNFDQCTQVITVHDTTPPVITCPADTTVPNGSGVCGAVADYEAFLMDNCDLNAGLSYSILPGSLFPIGTTPVTAVATDDCGNTDSCTFNVSVVDVEPPAALCQDITVYLDANGLVFVSGSDIDGGSSDNCGVGSVSSDAFVYGCGNVGQNSAVLTVTDIYGNVSTCTAQITVEDTLAPSISCQDVTVQLDANGNASIVPGDVFQAVSDNCGSVICQCDSLSQRDFDCDDVGIVSVVVTATDVNGNVASCIADVTVEDNIGPMALCQDITIQLGANGQASITASDVDGGSSDNCELILNVTPTNFDCSDIGVNQVVLTASDSSGNVANCTAEVTVEGNVAPNAVCQDVTVYLNSSGYVFVTVADIDGGSTAACGIASITTDAFVYGCGNVGVNTATLTVTDIFGNVSTCTANITVADTIPPDPICRDITVVLDANGSASVGAFGLLTSVGDNCGAVTCTCDSLSQRNFDCDDLGVVSVLVTASDVNGNFDTCTSLVTVVDTIYESCSSTSTKSGSAGEASSASAGIGFTSKFEAFPNPFNEETNLHIGLGYDAKVEVRLYDQIGKEVVVLFKGEVSEGELLEIDFRPGNLSKGIYYARLTTERGETLVRKLIFK